MRLILGFADGHITPTLQSFAPPRVLSVPLDAHGLGEGYERDALDLGVQQHERSPVRLEAP